MNRAKKVVTVTGEAARRLTGISTPFGGVQWADPGPSDTEIVRKLLIFLEDRRVLFVAENLEIPSEVHYSANLIRGECTKSLQEMGSRAFGCGPIRLIREACSQFQTMEREHFRFAENAYENRFSPGFFVALGSLRSTVCFQVAVLAAYYDLEVHGELAANLPTVDRTWEDPGDV